MCPLRSGRSRPTPTGLHGAPWHPLVRSSADPPPQRAAPLEIGIGLSCMPIARDFSLLAGRPRLPYCGVDQEECAETAEDRINEASVD